MKNSDLKDKDLEELNDALYELKETLEELSFLFSSKENLFYLLLIKNNSFSMFTIVFSLMLFMMNLLFPNYSIISNYNIFFLLFITVFLIPVLFIVYCKKLYFQIQEYIDLIENYNNIDKLEKK